MASSGNTWMKKLEAKAARFKRRQNGNTFEPLLNRTSSTHHEKAVALKAQKDLLHGFRHGRFVNKGGVRIIAIVDGTGVPDEVIKAPKTNAERAAADKRPPLKDVMVQGWKPRPYGKLNRRRLGLA
ncbi:hypothetical protein [Bradyrhizobium cenepequi]